MMRRLVIALFLVGCTQPPSADQSGPGPSAPRTKTVAPETGAPTAVRQPPRQPARKPPQSGAQVGQPIPAFTAEVLPPGGGVPRAIDSSKVKRPTAYVILGTTCPATAAYSERLVELEKQYAGHADFVYVYPNSTDSPDLKASFHRTKAFPSGHVDDQGGRIARMLGAKRTSEIYLTDAKGTLVYRGAIDDNREADKVKNRYLAMAIDETIAGKGVTTPTTDVHA